MLPHWFIVLVFSPFWFTFGLGLYLIRIFADYFRIRVHANHIHLHHFLLGFLWMFTSWFLFSQSQDFYAWLTAGLTAAFFASETKELILQKWKK